MSITEPNRLLLEYTQAMMGFLLFNASPGTIEIIGLGGGSLAKYCHAYLPSSNIRAVEIDEHVMAMAGQFCIPADSRSEEHTSELQSLMRISYAVFCLKKKKQQHTTKHTRRHNITIYTMNTKIHV